MWELPFPASVPRVRPEQRLQAEMVLGLRGSALFCFGILGARVLLKPGGGVCPLRNRQ